MHFTTLVQFACFNRKVPCFFGCKAGFPIVYFTVFRLSCQPNLRILPFCRRVLLNAWSAPTDGQPIERIDITVMLKIPQGPDTGRAFQETLKVLLPASFTPLRSHQQNFFRYPICDFFALAAYPPSFAYRASLYGSLAQLPASFACATQPKGPRIPPGASFFTAIKRDEPYSPYPHSCQCGTFRCAAAQRT